ncbi:phosphate-regulating neutral endopeptidase PHEX-like [Bactrocera neohumeralis]|uniref:phosphate-regulating neutral endopeptidase PHEX-like n=1 Tax=Bactrocera neohumeralis TaxID=98809 RepID=UPI0021669A6E|nr:phosphate-regulating neutral endopeptidase PHEX-like [Bactrocera neohumeralis]
MCATTHNKWLLATLVLLASFSATLQQSIAQNYSSGVLRMAKAAQIRAYIDAERASCDDFYEFACGRWRKLHASSASKPRSAYLDQLQDLYVRKSADMLQSGRETDNTADRKLTKFFESCRNEVAVQRLGLLPIIEFVDLRGGWPAIKLQSWYENEYDWLKVVGELRRRLGVNILIGLEVVPDFEENDMNRLKVGAPQLKLGGKQLYLDSSYDDEREDYRDDIAEKLHKYFPDMGERWAKEVAQQVLDIEQHLAKGLPDNTKLTLPQMTRQRFVSELKSAYGNYVDLNRYLTLVVNQTIYSKVYETPEEYFSNLVEVIRDTPKLHIANYTMWRVLEHLDFAGEINTPNNDNWCVRKIISFLPAQLQNMFNRNYNNILMVNELQSTWADIKRTFHDELATELDWLSENTRQHAKQKLEKIRLRLISHEDTELADQLRDLDIQPGQYFSNLINVLEWQTQHKLQALFSKPKSAQPEVRLPRYNPQNNNIEIPIVFLQSRFFWDAEYPHALRYGTLGYLLAHEMLRGFDAAGRRYDQHGYQRSWWDATSTETYDDRAKCFAENHYNNFKYRGQNLFSAKAEELSILDSGAVAIAQHAYQDWWSNVEDREDVLSKESLPLLEYTPQQLFFIGFAQLWCVDYHDSVEKFESTPEPLRVNGALANLVDFAREFKCDMGNKMHPQRKCELF